MTRRNIAFRKGDGFYISQEFNGDKDEAARFSSCMIDRTWPEILEYFEELNTLEDFAQAVHQAEQSYRYEHLGLEQVKNLPTCQEVWMVGSGCPYLYARYEKPTVEWVADLAREYGFKSRCSSGAATITARNTDGRWTTWFSASIEKDSGRWHIRGNNTDQCNIWLCQTRPDMTPERCVEFFDRLNETLGLFGEDKIRMSTWIDPEDWQNIAGVNDAYKDERYTRT